jgi:hypothetical protein
LLVCAHNKEMLLGEEERKYIQSIFLELGFKRVSQSTIIRPSALVSTSAGNEKSYANILKIFWVLLHENITT